MAERWRQLAAEIRALAARRRVSLSRLGTETGMSRTALYRRLDGTNAWTKTELEEVARVLDVTLDELLEFADLDPETVWVHGETKLAGNGPPGNS